MLDRIYIEPLGPRGLDWAYATVTTEHYLHRRPDPRTMPEGVEIGVHGVGRIGLLLFGRPEATRCYPWYGSVEDVSTGRAEVTRWQVLNLSRVWFSPDVQPGGVHYGPHWLPGFFDRRGQWRSTLGSTVIQLIVPTVSAFYLERRPPVFLHEPYQITWLMSYCDTRVHRGALYAATGFARYRINRDGIETWRLQLPPMSAESDARVRSLCQTHPRSRRIRAISEGANQLSIHY